jgi:hypothetical protein
VHHKELSLIVEETESKLLLELESEDGVSKRSLGSSLTSSSDSTGRASSSGARSLSPPHDLMLTESTDVGDGDDDGVMNGKDGGGEDDSTMYRQISLRGSGAAGSSAAILELAWRVVVSIIFLGWLRKEAPQQQRTSSRARGREKVPEDSSDGSSLPPESP